MPYSAEIRRFSFLNFFGSAEITAEYSAELIFGHTLIPALFPLSALSVPDVELARGLPVVVADPRGADPPGPGGALAPAGPGVARGHNPLPLRIERGAPTERCAAS